MLSESEKLRKEGVSKGCLLKSTPTLCLSDWKSERWKGEGSPREGF